MRREAIGIAVILGLLGGLGGCMQDIIREIAMQQTEAQKAIITSITSQVNWQDVTAALRSRLNNPRITIGAYYVQGALVDITTNGIESEVELGSTGTGGGSIPAEVQARIHAILTDRTLSEQARKDRIVDALASILPKGATTEVEVKPSN